MGAGRVFGRIAAVLLTAGLGFGAQASVVAVHDPSIVTAWRDASGNTYPENDAGKTRTKRSYVFGTQLGAAWSTDMANWTAFTPTFLANGAVSTDYLKVFAAAAAWSGHATSSAVQGNLWAPDVIWNKALGKWTMYTSVNGDDWLSSIVMDTASRIEGPYAYAGTVVYSGMDSKSSGAGNADYQAVTGSSTVASRYLDAGGNWTGTYGTSCIDPNVFYDEQGRLWMAYGSWSGGIFLLKLSEGTGLRDNTWNYGYGTSPAWIGTRLRYDPYMGVHLAGGYYVSGEGSYIRYLADPAGKNGHYYLFESMGFYSPEAGYTMRVFRSPTVDGVYTDATGDTAIAGKYVLNYGNNVQYGFPLMQNYKWSWWTKGQVAQGHNSVLRDEDGKGYLVYHRKFDDGTAFHELKVHPLVFDTLGWPLAAPFEQRAREGMRRTAVTPDEIAGSWGILVHRPVDYANLKSNPEEELRLNADGSVTGPFQGTWRYNYAGGRHFLKLVTDSGTFHGVLLEQQMDGLGSRTLAFTARNPANERALWGYRKPVTARSRTTVVADHSLKVGNADTTLAWDAYGSFLSDTASGDFEAEYRFGNATKGAENWHNWALALKNGSQTWYLRADAWSNSTFTGSTVGYRTDWNGTPDWKTAFRGKTVRLKVAKVGTDIDVFAWADSVLIESVHASGCPASGTYTVHLGGEAVLLDVSRRTVRSLGPRQRVGVASDDGTYPTAFGAVVGDTVQVSGNFELGLRFANHNDPVSTDAWDNWILRQTSTSGTLQLRADSYALNPVGTVAFSQDWSWGEFDTLTAGAQVEITASRTGSTVTHATRIVSLGGTVRTGTAVQSGAPTGTLAYGFTVENAQVDLQEVERVTRVGTSGGGGTVGVRGPATQPARLRIQGRSMVVDADRAGVAVLRRPDGRTVLRLPYAAGTTRGPRLEPGLYLSESGSLLVP